MHSTSQAISICTQSLPERQLSTKGATHILVEVLTSGFFWQQAHAEYFLQKDSTHFINMQQFMHVSKNKDTLNFFSSFSQKPSDYQAYERQLDTLIRA
ncbi:hypothetical protein TTHERM_00584710 (macronuclear) [Tetrahymena thermophila SB210]|uniref:Uncharacterized protein n=1 Tax=Tetrahymena thermophila (strain SB210) TaxID=312017 RepID=I7MG81_TETTS|nr:hypothetical protein TTHERM_00584710 [Tetrahymena thermophila SB210]EAR84915.1 hypothetical protein TTHERM_00584710 [Tetrahymena thermophila SB210]|eukprot:XP_001032578.1 hypothetical protein TTHERM_00584710 [Tetrahymena thermophila SB210]